jgi:hypothetical protein
MSKPLEHALSILDTFDQANESSALIVAKCRGLMRGYDARWRDAGYVARTVEQIYQAPLYNPATNAQSRTFSMAGKLDVMAELHGRTFIIDHKTTSQDIEDPNAPYWRQLAVEGQVNHYFLLQWVNGIKPDGAVWDAIRKPSISPKKLSKADVGGVVSRRTYCGVRMSDATLESLQTCERETLEMYEARLAHDCTVERPAWYFQRRPVPRMNHEVHEYATELWQHSQEILHTRQQQRATGQLPSRNSGACLLHNTPCRFLGICSGHDSPGSDRWRPKQKIHYELDGDVAYDKTALTNSRVRTFQTCRRKEYYEYELAIERQDQEESEALFFGHVIHEALRVWWESFLPEVPYVNGTDAARIECVNVPGDAAQLA